MSWKCHSWICVYIQSQKWGIYIRVFFDNKPFFSNLSSLGQQSPWDIGQFGVADLSLLFNITVFVLFLLKFKCIERKPKSPTMTVAVLLPNSYESGHVCLGCPLPSSWRTHTGPLLCHPKCAGTAHKRSLHGGLLHSPSPWLASHLNAAFGEASSHGSLLWPTCTASSAFTLP